MDAERLKDVPLFANLSKKERAEVARFTDELELPAGKVLGAEGSFAYEFFVIEEGTAEVTKEGERLTELGPGDFFGEIGLLESERRTATVTATSPMKVIVVFGRDFRDMKRQLPSVAEQVEAAIRERLARG
jgi:CRP-like cAMP-binding protein